ncbi:2982_t:CDS:1 [Gigaspora margarita]|uniref:2982_t:CDS:1 n=1 Tax=Gigaspora margarita TaxID=4874 RepID=A0ABN7XFF9_GIGMA|nr:2982_t:CDS:1 [Gigaspora margarita]
MSKSLDYYTVKTGYNRMNDLIKKCNNNIKFIYVKDHSGNEVNKKADNWHI